MRLGVYADDVYRLDGETLSADRAFIDFVAQLATRVGEVVLFGRLHPEPGASPYVLPREGVRLVPLPYYPSVADVPGLLRSVRGARSAFRAELDRLDAVLLFGPHPIALAFARAARRKDVPVVLGVRQDFPAYIGSRLPSRLWLPAVPAAHALELAFRALSAGTATVVVGEDLGRKYARRRAPLLVTGFSLVEAADVLSAEEALARSWDGELRLLTVGRLDSEKNPLLLPEILAGLRERDPRWRLEVGGTGPLAGAVERRAAELGVEGELELAGYIPHGPALLERYRRSHAFLHVSLTEGLPQVLFEAQAAGLPIVATDVGGVPDALGQGERGLLVPPRDAGAAVAALERLAADEELRRRLVAAGLEHMGRETKEAHLDRLASFLERAATSSS